MAAAGVLSDDDRVELIDGEIVDMTPIGSRHMACVDRLNRLLTAACGDRAIVRVQGPIRLGPRSEPQPDVTLLRPRPDFYAEGHPGPDSVLVLVEVADTSLDLDRSVKLPLYARAGIREVWLVDLAASRVVVHRTPGPDGYADVRSTGGDARLSPAAFPGLDLRARDIIG